MIGMEKEPPGRRVGNGEVLIYSLTKNQTESGIVSKSGIEKLSGEEEQKTKSVGTT